MQLSAHSFAVFVYPFSFDRGRFDALVAAVGQDDLTQGEAPWPVWERRPFPRDDLLRHVADYLNPAPGVPALAGLWTLGQRVLTSPRGLGLREDSASLCLRHRARTAGPDPAGEIPAGVLGLAVDGIDLALFRVGMGYLVFRVRLRSQAPDDWYDFLNGFRFIDRPGQVDLLIQRRTGPGRPVPYIPPLAAGPEASPDGRLVLAHLIRGLLGRLDRGAPDWWQEVFVPGQMLPFHALFFTGVPAGEEALVLYRLRNFFRSGQSLVPAADDLRPDHPALLPYAHRMWFSLTLEGGGFVAFDAPETPFWSETMPAHLREQYFLLFLFALHQRFTLMTLSHQVCARWSGGAAAQAEARFADLRETLLEFTARGNFYQIMQRDHHDRCFRAWREVFGTERLYREVGDAVRELHAMLLMRKTERLQQLAEEQRGLAEAQAHAEAERDKAVQARAERLGFWFGAIAFLLGFPALTLSYMDAVGPVTPRVALTGAALALLLGACMMALVQLRLRSGRDGRAGE
jgi:hypothetical protein